MIDINEVESYENDSTEAAVFQDAYLLNHVWGVDDIDSRKAAQSAQDALDRLIGRNIPGIGFEISAQNMARFFIELNRSEPHKAIEMILKTQWIADQIYFPNIPAFYDMLARQLKRKPSAIQMPASDDWKVGMIWFWAKSSRGIPPMCLWSDSLLLGVFRNAVSEEAIRKAISRLKLYRPKGRCYGPGLAPQGYFNPEKRNRGAVTKKK